MRNVAQVPLSREGFPGCESQLQREEINQLKLQESLSLWESWTATILLSLVFPGCWLQLLSSHCAGGCKSHSGTSNPPFTMCYVIFCRNCGVWVSNLTLENIKLKVTSGNEEYNPCGSGYKPKCICYDCTWFIFLGNQSNSHFFLVLTRFNREIVEEYKIPIKVKGIWF